MTMPRYLTDTFRTLGFFPPAPASGPLSMLDLPVDDWQCEAKLDGCRIIASGGQVWTRQGTPLTKPKGLCELRPLLAGISLTVEGEWVAREGRLYLFDLPDADGTYDERRALMERVVAMNRRPGLLIVPTATDGFRRFYADWRGRAEGVVLKRRASLYQKCVRPNTTTRDWIKRRFCWDTNSTETP